MICPYCKKEMEPGVIQSPHELSWQRKKHIFSASWLHNDSVVLSEFSFIRGSAVTAHLCRDCHAVIIKYDTPSSIYNDENSGKE